MLQRLWPETGPCEDSGPLHHSCVCVKLKCQIKWTEGHNWVTDNLVVSSKRYFLYKYVIMEDGKVKRWEKGANRIADLDVLPDLNTKDGGKSSGQLLPSKSTHFQK